MRLLSLGLTTAASDLYWLRFVSYLGSEEVVRDRAAQLYPLAVLITDLDPRFAYAHEAAGLALNSVNRLEEAQAILDIGVERNPGRWQTPFYAGFNAWNGLAQYEKGASLLLRAARIPGSPGYLTSLATRLFATSDAVQHGIAVIEALLADPSLPSPARSELEERLQALRTEHFIRDVEQRVDLFRLRNGRDPVDLSECGVGPGGPLVVPDGIELVLDSDGNVVIEGFERLKLYRPGA